jgi:hypothetical protein
MSQEQRSKKMKNLNRSFNQFNFLYTKLKSNIWWVCPFNAAFRGTTDVLQHIHTMEPSQYTVSFCFCFYTSQQVRGKIQKSYVVASYVMPTCSKSQYADLTHNSKTIMDTFLYNRTHGKVETWEV